MRKSFEYDLYKNLDDTVNLTFFHKAKNSHIFQKGWGGGIYGTPDTRYRQFVYVTVIIYFGIYMVCLSAWSPPDHNLRNP